MFAILAQRGWPRRALPASLTATTLVVVFEIAASGRFSSTRLALAIALVPLLVTGVITLAARRPGWFPPALVVFAALVPYPVSFVGKTPFGVVSATGAVGLIGILTILLTQPAARAIAVRGAEIWAMVAWIGLMTLSSLGSDYRVTLNRTRLLAVAVLLAYVCGRIVATVDARALDRLIVAVGVVAVLAILEEVTRLSPYSLVTSSGFPLSPPPAATRLGLIRVRLGFYHGSVLGTLLAVALPLAVVRLRRTRQHAWVLAAVPAALLLTLTSQAWVASTIALVVVAVGVRGTRSTVLIGALVGLTVLASGVVAPANQLIEVRLHPTGSYADQASYRLALLPTAARFASTAPLLGAGPGTFNDQKLTAVVNNVYVLLVDDNTYASAIVETGYPGLALLLLVVLLVGRRFRADPVRWRAWAGLAALAAWLVMGLSVDLLASDQVLMPVWLLLGALSARAFVPSSEAAPTTLVGATP